MIKDLKISNPHQWYSKLKRMTSYDQHVLDLIIVDQIRDKTDQEQADFIAESFASISREYEPLQTNQINIPKILPEEFPIFTQKRVLP